MYGNNIITFIAMINKSIFYILICFFIVLMSVVLFIDNEYISGFLIALFFLSSLFAYNIIEDKSTK